MNEMGENERIRHRIHPHHSGQQVEAPSHSSFEGFADFVVSTSVFGLNVAADCIRQAQSWITLPSARGRSVFDKSIWP
jgi:hypothetical protein